MIVLLNTVLVIGMIVMPLVLLFLAIREVDRATAQEDTQ